MPAAASAAPITEFTAGLPSGSDPSSLTVGPDGNVWFVDVGAIGRITPSGQITEFTAGLNPGSMPSAIVAASDGNLWFTDPGTTKAIGKITPTGQITETPAGQSPLELTTGANGTLWFTDPMAKAIGRIIPSTGAIKEFDYSTLDPVSDIDEITAGPDGNVYFTDRGNNRGVGKITPDGSLTETLTGIGTMPAGIGAGADGNVWFSDQSTPAIGRVTPGGVGTEFAHADGLQTNSAPDEITAGPDGNVWFDDQEAGSDMVGRITPSGHIMEFPTAGTPWKIVDGLDGNLWLLQSQPNAVLRVTPAGTITAITDGLRSTADLIDTDITEGPDGNVWFVDKGTPTAIGRADVQLAPTASTGAASALTTSSATVAGEVDPLGSATTVSFQYGTSPALGSSLPAGSLKAGPDPSTVTAGLTGLPAGTTVYYRVLAANAYGTTPGAIQKFTTVAVAKPIPTPPATRTSTATLGNQQVALTLPTACTARSRSLSIALSTATIPRSAAAKLRFVSAALYLDRGIRHVRTRHVHGKTRKVTTYTSNKVVRKLPARPSLRLAGLRSGQHTLKVRLLFDKRKTVPVRKTLSAKFRVC
jgi:streptogramin lyase